MNINIKNHISRNKGFTLVELLVTISMFVIITGVVLVNSNKFDSTVLLNNFAYDVALTIKQAQSYGVNVKESSSGSFTSAYGVYFNRVQSPTNFVLFNDTIVSSSTDSVLTCSAVSECVQKYSMTRGTYVSGICTRLNSTDACVPTDRLSILFQRPSLTANIYAVNSDRTLSPLQSYAKITLSSANGATSSVVVTSIGQIYVKK